MNEQLHHRFRENFGRPAISHLPWKSRFSVLMFVIGTLTYADIQIIGRVPLSEVVAFLSIPFLIFAGGEFSINGNFKKATVIILAIMVGVAASDIVNRNYLELFFRGFAKPLFIFLWMVFLIIVIRRDIGSMFWYVAGTIVASVANYLKPSAYVDLVAISEYERIVFVVAPVGISIALTLSILLYRKYGWTTILWMVLLAAFLLVMKSARSQVLISLLTAVLVAYVIWTRKKTVVRPQVVFTAKRVISLSVIGIVSSVILYYSYIWAAENGHLGEYQQRKLEQQSDTVFGISPLGLVLSGRTAVFAAILGIIDRPLFGFGSWRADLTSPYLYEAMRYVGTDPSLLDSIAKGAELPGAGHSVFFQSWIENGLIPAAGYLVIFFVSVRSFLVFVRRECFLTPWVIFVFLSFAWSFLFSPFYTDTRFFIGFFLAVWVVFLDERHPISRIW